MPWYRKLHWQIIIGLTLGIAYGVVAAASGWGQVTEDWIAPFGTIFINALQLIAVPLVLSSLTTGVASLSDLKSLSRIGGKTLVIYIATTAVAVTIGLVIVNTLRPGDRIPLEVRQELEQQFAADAGQREAAAEMAADRGPLQLLVDIVPANFFSSATSNSNMLQVVFVALFVGVGLILVTREQAAPMLGVFESLNEVVIKLVDLVMLAAPLGVFALIARTITGMAADNLQQVLELLGALGFYCLAVTLGLLVQTFVVYPTLIRLFTTLPVSTFIAGVAPVQLVGFSTSSSGATLPVTMERAQETLGVSEEISSFVLPLGATINMDGTALYQAVAAVFIAQSVNMTIGLQGQLTIVLTAVLASIGTAAVPGAGIIMLVIILQAINVPPSGIALILGVDRILDMMRTATNVTGDTTVAAIIASSEGQLHPPVPTGE